jgi:mono/diheme cytochrome c family protein
MERYFVIVALDEDTGEIGDQVAGDRMPPINQLADWRESGILVDALGASEISRAPAAYDPEDGTLDTRARAYLHVNCAHCHNPAGPAHTSGLDLRWTVDDPVQWGVRKRPVAAGRASAGMDFSIAPGDPDHSILLHRMESLDPGVMMPELGRQTVDARGVALIRDWIAGMDESGRPQQ